MAFKQRFIEPILDGSKRQTLRKAQRARGTIEKGDIIVATCRWDQPPFARLRVTEVVAVQREDLGERDAAADGFASLEELVGFLDDAYGDVESFVRISFEPLEEGA